MLNSLFFAGIGGQGVVTMAEIIMEHLRNRGMKAALIHATGMAQRGGRVTSEIRFSDEHDRSFGPRISRRGADVLVGMELAETINSAEFLKPGGCLIALDYALVPSQFVLDRERFAGIEDVRNVFSGITTNLNLVTGAEPPLNMHVLGVFTALMSRAVVSRSGDPSAGGAWLAAVFDPDSMRATLKGFLKKRVEENLRAFEAGLSYRA